MVVGHFGRPKKLFHYAYVCGERGSREEGGGGSGGLGFFFSFVILRNSCNIFSLIWFSLNLKISCIIDGIPLHNLFSPSFPKAIKGGEMCTLFKRFLRERERERVCFLGGSPTLFYSFQQENIYIYVYVDFVFG